MADLTHCCPWHRKHSSSRLLRAAMIGGCLLPGLAACSNPVDCSGGNYRGGCYPGTPLAAAPAPAATPVAASPAGAAAPLVERGDPATFAVIDDKQCRSYGLIFGTRDYADCRIRLSAQHRGLDPNIGTSPANAPGR